MFKLEPGHDHVVKSIRITQAMALDLERLAKENNLSFNSVVTQCLRYALSNMGSAEESREKAE